MTNLVVGVVADDLTGATDVAGTLVARGVRTTLHTGSAPAAPPAGTGAAVVALKTRTVPADEAVARSLEAWSRLATAGASAAYYKYCSTFDSTPAGNIGPVTDALAAAVGEPLAVACPAFPANGRTVYEGHLFVGDVLLHDSPMAHHPLTPMTDANLVRWLGHQTERPVGLLPYAVVVRGADAIRNHLVALQRAGTAHVIADALDDDHVRTLGQALADRRLVTGGSALAGALAAAWQADGTLPAPAPPPAIASSGPAAVVAGSCSAATLEQLAVAERAGAHVTRIDPMRMASSSSTIDEAVDAAVAALAGDRLVVVAASAPPDEVRRAQDELGRDRAAAITEDALSRAAEALVDAGVGRLIVAGGETSGAVIERLGIESLEIGAELAPGVPAALAHGGFADDHPLAVALKSGNFGGPDFFAEAARGLDRAD